MPFDNSKLNMVVVLCSVSKHTYSDHICHITIMLEYRLAADIHHLMDLIPFYRVMGKAVRGVLP